MEMWLSRLLPLIYVFSVQVDAAELTSDVARFIPSCAQSCVQSFVNVNFPSCSEEDQLACVCSTSGTSEYTVGEGAIQCMTGEVSGGGCGGPAVPAAVQFVNAYQMCNGQPGALSNTHTALTATLQIDPTNSPHLVVPNPTTTSSTTSSTSTTSSPTSLASSTSTSAGASESSGDRATPDVKLTTPQIVGIAIAAVGGIALALGAILFLFCYRKKRYKQRDSDMFGGGQIEPPSRSDSGYRVKNNIHAFPGDTVDGIAARMPPIPSPPERPPRPATLEDEYRNPEMGYSPNLNTGTIGLAISELGGNTAERHVSRHASILGASDISGSSHAEGDIFIYKPQRRSVATTIEEEPDSSNSGRDSWGARSTDRILSTISLGEGKLMDVNQNPNPSFLVTGSDGTSWRASSESEQGRSHNDYYVKPLTLSKDFSRDPGKASKPAKPRFDLSQFPAPPPIPPARSVSRDQGERSRTDTVASSYYGTENSLPSSPAGQQFGPDTSARNQQSYKNSNNPWANRQSSDSLTTVTTMESTLPASRVSKALSPVQESPASLENKRPSVSGPLHLFPIQATVSSPQNIETPKPLKSAEIAAMRAMRLRQKPEVNMQHPLERAEPSTSAASGATLQSRKPADLRVDTQAADKSKGKKPAWKVVDTAKEDQLTSLTPTRKGDELYLKVQQ